mgnify:CR=1 FL=1
MKSKMVLGVCLLALAGCKVSVEVPSQGGSVTTVSGDYSCTSGSSCVIDVSDTSFDQRFVAVPDDGYRFVAWKKRDRGFFGNSRNPEARLATTGFPGNDGLMSVLKSDDVFFLQPTFARLPAPAPARSGGAPGDPTALSFDGPNTVDVSSFHNNFSLVANQGQKLVIGVALSLPMSDQQKSRCASNPGAYPTKITVFDDKRSSVAVSCGESMLYEFEEAGDYTVNFEYPDNGGGQAFAVLLPATVNFAKPLGPRGSALNAIPLLTGVRNQLGSQPFFNYFRVSVDKGTTMVLDVSLERPLSQTQRSRCASSPGDGARPSSYDTQVHIYDGSLSRIGGKCGETLSYTFGKAGTYLVNFDYGAQSAGYFNVALIR